MKDPTSRAAIVTGAASGIGRALMARLVEAGHFVVATDIDIERLRADVAVRGWPPERVVCERLDVRDAAGWSAIAHATVGRFGAIAMLFNVAGYLRPGRVHAFDPEESAQHLLVNAGGVMLGTRIVSEVMVGQGFGHIVNIASLAGLAPVPGLSNYCASKFAVRGFSLAAAMELRPRGVHVTVVCPDAVETPMLLLQEGYEEAALTFSGPRVLTVDEVVDAIMKKALRHRPLEVVIPSGRGWMARLGGLSPDGAQVLRPALERRGLAHQAKRRGGKGGGAG